MTRETKLGLVVAGSLMCLMGALIGKKMLFEEKAEPDYHEQIVAKNDSPPTPEKKKVDANITEPNKHLLQNESIGVILPVKGTSGNNTGPDPKNGANPTPNLPPIPPGPPPILNGDPNNQKTVNNPAQPGAGSQPTLEEILAEKAKQNGLGAFAKPPTLSIPPALPGKPPAPPEPVGPEQLAQLINNKPMPPGLENKTPPIPPEIPDQAKPGSAPIDGKPGQKKIELPEFPPPVPPEIPGGKNSGTDPKTGKPNVVDPKELLPPAIPGPGSSGPSSIPPESGKNNVPEIKTSTGGILDIPPPPVAKDPLKAVPEAPPKQPDFELPKPPEPAKGSVPPVTIGTPPPVGAVKKEPEPGEQQGLPQVNVKAFGQVPEPPIPPMGKTPPDPKKDEGKIPEPSVPPLGSSPPEVKKDAGKIPDPPTAPLGSNPPEVKKETGNIPEPPMPPLGTTPPVKLGPMPIPMAPNSVEPKKQVPSGPVVSEYEDEILQCQPDTLTFSDISKKYYRSEAYADALLLYNRNHPNGPASIKQVPPQLQVGQTVYIPPTIILETRYAQAIKNFKPLPQTPAIEIKPPVVATTPNTPPQGSQSFSATNSGGPPPIKITDKSTLEQTPQGPIYEVKTGNEMLLEIARQTLGDSRRWSEIYRLNPGINPAYPLPIGTRLKLPGTAKANP